jgi:23S rRNA (cytidine1920-2'-O)/16S rRNA (cytidine1409-2'-O)-methyltransferase
MEKKRLDILMEERGIAHSRTLAQRLIMAGSVRVNGRVVLKPGDKVGEKDLIELIQAPRFVSRGGEKLQAALEAFELTDLESQICVDVGASTGGFTDCLLQHQAAKVYALDVGYGILDWKIRTHERVVVMEKTNARFVNAFPDPIDLVTIDASFISLKTLLPVIQSWFTKPAGRVIALIKPQFEAGRVEAARGSGVIRDPLIHRRVLIELLNFAQEKGFQVDGLIKSPLTGPKGNTEFLVNLSLPRRTDVEISRLIDALLPAPANAKPESESGTEMK